MSWTSRRQAVARRENGLNMPSAEKIIELAGLFEVPVSELVGGKTENGGTLRARVSDVAKVFAAYALLYVVCTLASERVATPVLELYGLWYWCSRHFVLPLCFFVSALAWDLRLRGGCRWRCLSGCVSTHILICLGCCRVYGPGRAGDRLRRVNCHRRPGSGGGLCAGIQGRDAFRRCFCRAQAASQGAVCAAYTACRAFNVPHDQQAQLHFRGERRLAGRIRGKVVRTACPERTMTPQTARRTVLCSTVWAGACTIPRATPRDTLSGIDEIPRTGRPWDFL